ncbi:MAG: Two-component system regulatory protein [Lactococcus sp.]|jgi:hypothetical protein
MKFLKPICNFFTYLIVITSILSSTYNLLNKIGLEYLWTLMALIVYACSIFLVKIYSMKISIISVSSSTVFSLFFTVLYIKNQTIHTSVTKNLEWLLLGAIFIIFLNIMINGFIDNIEQENVESKQKIENVFNLFYVNTSKMHEIVMLLDNKIMKSIEREHHSEELLKYNNNGSLKFDQASIEVGYSKEESYKRRIYENFDVKTTKSIMLKKLYEIINKLTDTSGEEIEIGKIVLFKNVRLKQRNIDDTVMILNALQDSNIKPDSDENVELNLNRIMDRMLDDFTIDYKFNKDEKEYIIQLPYKDNENFENGYLHHDLQLGELSIIGIYRGEIDFKDKHSTSSKFLELTSKELKKSFKAVDEALRSSNYPNDNNESIKFEYKKLEDKLHLVDIVAIIQELNIS